MLSTEQELVQAIRDGNLEKVKRIIDNGEIGVNSRYSGPIDGDISFDGDTLLHVATYFGRLDIMEYLIDKGAELNLKCNFGNTPLVNAMMGNQIEAFKFLIARSNDNIINAKNKLGETLLHMAAQKNQHEFIEELLRTEVVDPNIPDEEGRTPVMVAIIDIWKMESLRLLLGDRRTNIDDGVYESIFLNNYPRLPVFSVTQQNDSWHEANNLLMEKVPSKFLCGEVPQDRGSGWPYIDFIFSFKQELIPQLLEMLSELDRDDIFLKAKNVASIDFRINNPRHNEDVAGYSPCSNLSDYKNAREAIEKYCERNDVTENYRIVPGYLLSIKDCDKEAFQHFKDIYNIIDSENFNEIKKDSEDFNKIKESLNLIEENVKKSDIDINDINKALTILVREAKFNEHVARLISDYQANINYLEEWEANTTSHLKNPDSQNVNLSTGLRK